MLAMLLAAAAQQDGVGSEVSDSWEVNNKVYNVLKQGLPNYRVRVQEHGLRNQNQKEVYCQMVLVLWCIIVKNYKAQEKPLLQKVS